MSRSLRRHPVVTKTPKSAAPMKPPRPPKGGAPTRHGWRAFVPRWLDDIAAELRKVTWPTRQETINLTIVVGVVTLAIGLFLGGVDSLFAYILTNTILR